MDIRRTRVIESEFHNYWDDPRLRSQAGGASYTLVAKVTMDLRLRESTHLQTKAEEKRRHGVPYGYGEFGDVQSRQLRNSDGRYVRVVRPDTTYHDRKKSIVDVYDEAGVGIASDLLVVKEEYTM
jgi:hypothetical protein